MKDLNTLTKDYIVSLQKYIDELENGKQIQQDDLMYSYELDIVLGRCMDIQSTSQLPCFNGVYNINQDSFDYYMRKLTEEHKLKLIKDDDFPNHWLVSDGNEKHEVLFSIFGTSNDIEGVNTNRIDIEFMSYSVQIVINSFSELDNVLSEIKDGILFKEFK